MVHVSDRASTGVSERVTTRGSQHILLKPDILFGLYGDTSKFLTLQNTI